MGERSVKVLTIEKKPYQFKNKVCPICGKPVGQYFWKLDDMGRKIHLDCKDAEK